MHLGSMRIVSMCGSLGATSANRQALDLAIDWLRSQGIVHAVTDVPIGNVPMLKPDSVDDPPGAVATMQSLLEAADGVLLAVPEYAGGLAGGMKNALDWLAHHRSITGRSWS